MINNNYNRSFQSMYSPRPTEYQRMKKADKKNKIVKSISLGLAIMVLSGVGYSLSRGKPSANVSKSSNIQISESQFTKDLKKNILEKTQKLYQNSYENNNRHTLKERDAYHYCMYVANLFMGGDDMTVNYVAGNNDTVAAEVDRIFKNSQTLSYENDEKIIALANLYNVSQNRIAYSATPLEAQMFRSMPIETQKLIIDQFLEVANQIRFEMHGSYGKTIKSDYPSWYVGLYHKYNYEKLVDAARDYLEMINPTKKTSFR